MIHRTGQYPGVELRFRLSPGYPGIAQHLAAMLPRHWILHRSTHELCGSVYLPETRPPRLAKRGRGPLPLRTTNHHIGVCVYGTLSDVSSRESSLWPAGGGRVRGKLPTERSQHRPLRWTVQVVKCQTAVPRHGLW